MSKKRNKFLICFVLDETGSMQIVKDTTISGYNEYINNLRKQKNTTMMLVRFNSQAIKLGKPELIKDATALTVENYQPDALTPLYDAVGQSIREVEKLASGKNVIFVIMTDGLENASKEYKREAVFSMIKEKPHWKFVYLGANQDAYAEGFKLGVPTASAMNYSQSRTVETFNVMSRSTSRYMEDPDIDKDFFESNEKEQANE